jgi:hypothetical protein
MFCVSLLPNRPLRLLGLGLLAAMAAAPGARAADLDYDDPPPPVTRRYDPPPYREPLYDPPVVRRRVERDDGPCRIVHRRSFDAYGREIVRRIRECDEGVVAWDRGWSRERRYAPPPAYDPPPRPPVGIVPPYDDDPD